MHGVVYSNTSYICENITCVCVLVYIWCWAIPEGFVTTQINIIYVYIFIPYKFTNNFHALALFYICNVSICDIVIVASLYILRYCVATEPSSQSTHAYTKSGIVQNMYNVHCTYTVSTPASHSKYPSLCLLHLQARNSFSYKCMYIFGIFSYIHRVHKRIVR